MDVLLLRDTRKINHELSGNYSIETSVHSKNKEQRLALAGDERNKYRELYPELRKKHDQIRVEIENKLRVLNYKIDVKYRNPDDK